MSGVGYAFPLGFIAYGTMLFGAIFLMMAWANRGSYAPGKARYALYSFTTAVLLDALISLYDHPSDVWLAWHEYLWTFIVISILIASFVFTIIAVVLTLRSPGTVKIGSRVLFVINLLGFTWLIWGK